MSVKYIISLALVVTLIIASPALIFADSNQNGSNECKPAGSTGLTAFMIVHSNKVVTGMTINANGCDIGIYVPPGSKNVVINHDNIYNANIHGIFVQDSSHVVIDHNYVHDNSFGVAKVSCDFVKPPCVAEGKAIQLSGVSNSVVSENIIINDMFGGIGVSDDGPIDPGALNPGDLHPANHNLIVGNKISQVSHDCGIVVATYNAEVAIGNKIVNNNVQGSLPPFGVHPYVGQIVVATDGPGGRIIETVIVHNVVNGSTLPGIVLHANAPGDSISGTVIKDNVLGFNGYYPPFFASPNTPVASDGPTGISVVAEAYQGMTNPPTITATLIIHNTISPDTIGVWLCKTTGTKIINTPDAASSVTTPLQICSNGGS